MAAPAVSGSVLVNRVRVLGEYLETTGSNGYADSYITDDIVLEELSNANAEVHRLYAESDNDFRLTRCELSLVSGSDPYDLPSDLSHLRAVQVRPQGSSTGWVPLRRADIDDDLDADSSSTEAEAYRVIGSQIELLPPPTAGTMRLSYVPCPERLTSLTGTIYAVDGYENLLVLRAVRLLKMREGYATVEWDMRIAEGEAAMKAAVRRRDRAVPRKLRDPRGGPRTRRLGWRR